MIPYTVLPALAAEGRAWPMQADGGSLAEARMAYGSAEGDSGGRCGAAGQIRFGRGQRQ
jgi:hypothetical protein